VAAAVTAYLESVSERLRRAELAQAAEEARRAEAQATAEQERKAREAAQAKAAAERRARRLTLCLAVTVVLAAGLGMAAWNWFKREHERAEAEAAHNQVLQAKREALEDMSIEDSRSTQRLMLLLQKQEKDSGAQHVVKKIQLVQTLGRLVFADSPKSRSAALENWRLLEDNLKKSVWFPQFLDRRRKDLDAITVDGALEGLREACRRELAR
jgi:hypothetical protein